MDEQRFDYLARSLAKATSRRQVLRVLIAGTLGFMVQSRVASAGIGCTSDAQCTSGNWCNESTSTCTPKLPNGSAMPTDPPHTNPTLNGMCMAAAGALVCSSGVCDTNDNKCGYANGDGPCTAGNGSTICRSGVCDADDKCGYANGDGPCTAPTGPVVCRSGVCSVSSLCEPAAGCNVDADCTGGNWCNESTHACTPQLANGVPIPTDPPHTNPTLNGICTPTAAVLVCTSGVCDTDNECGYANGDGPCNATNSVVVCRSGACSANGTCEPLNGCNVDQDCSGGWCNESTHTCTAKLTNGSPIPTDPPHTNPTLNGMCTAGAAALVCTSGVCDVNDNLCGYANGDGPCTGPTGPVVCRSGVCSISGVCEPVGGCTVDADCTGGNWCNESTHTCTAKLANGSPIPSDPPHTNPTLNGMCIAAAAVLVCISDVCDVNDNRCGYANGDGPCTGPTGPVVCRSGVCSVSGVCEPAGGCNADADCSSGNWCNESTHTCTAQLANGSALPNDPPHTSPTLNGNCTPAAAALVCISGVCDGSDNKCGYLNGDGPCTTNNGPTVCRSGVCDSDGRCGYANGDGPCTAGNGATVCRSGSCAGAICSAGTGCTSDVNCQATSPLLWCNETQHICTAKLPNGFPIPTDPAHTNPTLNGTCIPGAGAAVCVAGVCDTSDNKCGLANGSGPCTLLNAATVCRSGACSNNATCIVPGTCNIDTDCPSGLWCNQSSHTCSAKLANGSAIPIDPTHASPVINGTCLPGTGAAVCTSGICDPIDNKCGLANGHGPCTPANAATVCRSIACSNSGTCISPGTCNVDADCPSFEWCNAGTHACTPRLNNGSPIPSDPGHINVTLNGSCLPAAAALVCFSGVCDAADNKCGLANGDGPCTPADAGTVCRSGSCGSGGLCIPPGGCNIDADCPSGLWCNESSHTCNAKLPNGAAIPVDPPHVSPMINGTCLPGTGAAVCLSGVCDPIDNKCGLANGDGPCTPANAATVCRSSACGSNGTCIPPGGCVVDTDCITFEWCNAGTRTCTVKLGNGSAIPVDPAHVSPVINGTCLPGTGVVVCLSGVCDSSDNKCGLAAGHGPCTPANGATVCRSGFCANGAC